MLTDNHWAKHACGPQQLEYERMEPGDPLYDMVQRLWRKGEWACDSYDHNESYGCSNPECFKHAKRKI